jgi:hypothetical protein
VVALSPAPEMSASRANRNGPGISYPICKPPVTLVPPSEPDSPVFRLVEPPRQAGPAHIGLVEARIVPRAADGAADIEAFPVKAPTTGPAATGYGGMSAASTGADNATVAIATLATNNFCMLALVPRPNLGPQTKRQPPCPPLRTAIQIRCPANVQIGRCSPAPSPGGEHILRGTFSFAQ